MKKNIARAIIALAFATAAMATLTACSASTWEKVDDGIGSFYEGYYGRERPR